MTKFLIAASVVSFLLSCSMGSGAQKLPEGAVAIKGRNLVLSYDDSQPADYTRIFPVHKKYGVPAELSVWNIRMASSDSSKDQLTWPQLLEMRDFGYEIMSHSFTHLPMQELNLLQGVTVGETIIKTNQDKNFTWALAHKPRQDFELVEGDIHEDVLIKSLPPGGGIELEGPLQHAYTQKAVFRLTANSLSHEFTDSLDQLKSHGIKAPGFTYPFGENDARTTAIAKTFVTTARVALPGHPTLITPPYSDKDLASIVYEEFVPDPYNINTVDFVLLTQEQIRKVLDLSKAENFLVLLFSHAYNPRCTPELVSFIIEEAQKRNISITTRSAALELTAKP